MLFVASGDLSHRAHPRGAGAATTRAASSSTTRRRAAQRGRLRWPRDARPRSARAAPASAACARFIALGGFLGDDASSTLEVLSYEGPFGVGYLVAGFGLPAARWRARRTGSVTDRAVARRARPTTPASASRPSCGGRPVPAAPDGPLFARRAACFVSLKKRGQLRGCIGTLEPAEPTWATRSPATPAPRPSTTRVSAAVREDELADLAYSVDVLSESEPCTLEDLDPRVYGVIVGVRLPARRAPARPGGRRYRGAAGRHRPAEGRHRPDEEFSIRRFTVTRYREGEGVPGRTGAADD